MKIRKLFPAFVISLSLYACNAADPSSDHTTEITPVIPAEQPEVKKPGQAIFERKCAACHGNDGAAGIGNAANLRESKLDSAAVVKVVTEGKGAMPSFGTQLSREELAVVSRYVFSLH